MISKYVVRCQNPDTCEICYFDSWIAPDVPLFGSAGTVMSFYRALAVTKLLKRSYSCVTIVAASDPSLKCQVRAAINSLVDWFVYS